MNAVQIYMPVLQKNLHRAYHFPLKQPITYK